MSTKCIMSSQVIADALLAYDKVQTVIRHLKATTNIEIIAS